jgi:hypothetical protein
VIAKAASCWLPGLWADALGEESDARQEGIDKRCSSLLDEIETMPTITYASVRNVDERFVIHLSAQLRTHGAAELEPLLRSIADTAREQLHARRAADTLKRDYGDENISREHRMLDKTDAAKSLRESKALTSLLHYDGPLAQDAHAIGLLFALDRMEISRGLPKHLKIYAVDAALHEVFGVEAPHVSEDVTSPIPTGTWLAYLTRAASAAGHPLPANEKDVFDRETFAWTGVLAGFSDRLRATKPDPRIAQASDAVAVRLADEHAAARNVAAHRPKKK